jgi:hypothetical protein
MRKFIVTLFILLALAGTVFFFGWAQFPVPPGAYGVVTSKTHGVDPHLVRSGEFRWIWYKLIPTNVQITVFRLEPVSRQLNLQNTLPSAAVYAAFAESSDLRGKSAVDFSWEIKGTLSFTLRPESLIALVSEQGINSQEALDAWRQELAEKIEGRAMIWLGSTETSAETLEEILKSGASPELEAAICGQFPQIASCSFTVASARFPDFALYKQTQALYQESLSRRQQITASAFGRQAENQIAAQMHFDELERYGALLAKYPVLLEYLALEKGLWKGSADK